eukprot:s48_g22.t1
MHFEPPHSVSLATGSAFGSLEVPGGGPPLEIGGVDIADAFYHIALEDELQDYFCLAPVRAEDVGVSVAQGKKLKPGDKVFPALKVVPMGWTLALWICQSAHEHVVDAHPAIDPALRCVDRRPVPEVVDYDVHTQYVGNFVAISQTSGRARSLAESIGVALNQSGLPTHEVEAGVGLETLGWAFGADHPTVKITGKRMWRLRLATLELLKQGWATVTVGHFTFAGLLQRGVLSVFQASCVFFRKCYHQQVELWPEVKRKLRWAASLLCLVKRDLAAEWSGRVHATDASMWGRGVTAALRPVEEIKKLGRRNDRWRFKSGEEDMVTKLELEPWPDRTDPETLTSEATCHNQVGTGDYLEVPLQFIGEDWSKVDGAKWDRVEPIPVLEGRAVVWLCQHLARSQKNLGRKHLILTDSMSVTLALTKGRSSSSSMNRVCRQVAAITLATGMMFHLRWIPSELNPADFPSRAQDLKGFSLSRGLQELQDSHASKEHKSESGWRESAIKFHCGVAKCQQVAGIGQQRGQIQEATHSPFGTSQCNQGGQEVIPEGGEGIREKQAPWQESRALNSEPEVFPRTEVSGDCPTEVLREGLGRPEGVGSRQRTQYGVNLGAVPAPKTETIV